MVKPDFDIRQAKSIIDIVDCIQENTYGEAPKTIVDFFETMDSKISNNYLRTLLIPIFFHEFEKKIPSVKDPISEFSSFIYKIIDHFNNLLATNSFEWLIENAKENSIKDNFNSEVKAHTGQHYGNLFSAFDQKSYFVEAKQLLQTRIERNDIQLENLKNSYLLDQGCGGGRYTTAWKLLGAKKCVGIDFSEIGLQDASKRVDAAKINDVEFIKGSVLEMPFEDNTFDIVYSNGVLHHTSDWKKGIREQLRVMKPGGWGWQYLIEKPGGIFWDQIEILRAIMRKVPKPFAQEILNGLNIPANRVFYMLDHVMVPINTRLSSFEIENELEANGAREIVRLKRGTDFDRIEQVYKNVPYAYEKFGIGENRFVFTKA